MIPYKRIIFRGLKIVKDCSPTALTIGTCVGVVLTGIMAVRCWKNAERAVEDATEKKQNDEQTDEVSLTKWEMVKAGWKSMLPVIFSGGATIACALGANHLHIKKETALMTALGMSEMAMKEYREAAVDEYGDDADAKIKSRAHNNFVRRNPPGTNVIDTGTGDILFFEDHTEQWFRASKERVLSAEYELNRYFRDRDSVSLGVFCKLLGIPEKDGDGWGWESYTGETLHGYTWIDFFNTEKTTDDGIDYIHISYPYGPFCDVDVIDDLIDCGVDDSELPIGCRFRF